MSGSIDNSFKQFCSMGNEKNTAWPGEKLGSGEVFLKI